MSAWGVIQYAGIAALLWAVSGLVGWFLYVMSWFNLGGIWKHRAAIFHPRVLLDQMRGGVLLLIEVVAAIRILSILPRDGELAYIGKNDSLEGRNIL